MKVLRQTLVPRMCPAPRDSSVPADYQLMVYGNLSSKRP